MKPADRRVICIEEGGRLDVPGEPGHWVVSRRLEEWSDPLLGGLFRCLLEVRPATMRERVRYAVNRKPWKDTWRQEQKLADGGPRYIPLP